MKMFKKFLANPYNKLITLLVKEKLTVEDKEDIVRLLANIDFKKLFYIARENEVAAIMYPNFIEFLDQDDTSSWGKQYTETKLRISWMMQKLDEVAEKLKTNNIDIVALKNAGISMGLKIDYGKSPMGDIDTLVRKSDFQKAHELILSLGFKFKFRSQFEKEEFNSAFIDGSTEYEFVSDDKKKNMWLELAWRPIAGRWINQDSEPDSDELLDNSKTISPAGIRMLSAEDNLLQVCIHTAKHSYIRKPGFRLHLDVERIVGHENIDWQLFTQKAKGIKTRTAVYFSLLCAKVLFATQIPASVLKELKPNILKELYVKRKIEKMNLIDVNKMSFNRIEFIFFQCSLYDDIRELMNVAFPNKDFLLLKYKGISIIKARILHLLDLLGVRKKIKK